MLVNEQLKDGTKSNDLGVIFAKMEGRRLEYV